MGNVRILFDLKFAHSTSIVQSAKYVKGWCLSDSIEIGGNFQVRLATHFSPTPFCTVYRLTGIFARVFTTSYILSGCQSLATVKRSSGYTSPRVRPLSQRTAMFHSPPTHLLVPNTVPVDPGAMGLGSSPIRTRVTLSPTLAGGRVLPAGRITRRYCRTVPCGLASGPSQW